MTERYRGAGRSRSGVYPPSFFFGLQGKRTLKSGCPGTKARAPFVLVEYYRVLVFVLV